jgi:hypothetical protein
MRRAKVLKLSQAGIGRVQGQLQERDSIWFFPATSEPQRYLGRWAAANYPA